MPYDVFVLYDKLLTGKQISDIIGIIRSKLVPQMWREKQPTHTHGCFQANS